MALCFKFALRPVDIRALTIFEFDLFAGAIDELSKGATDG